MFISRVTNQSRQFNSLSCGWWDGSLGRGTFLKPNNLNSITSTHMVGENQLLQAVHWPKHAYHSVHAHLVHTCVHTHGGGGEGGREGEDVGTIHCCPRYSSPLSPFPYVFRQWLVKFSHTIHDENKSYIRTRIYSQKLMPHALHLCIIIL